MINPVRDAGRIYGEFSPRLGIFPFFLEIKNETGKITSEFFFSISKYGFEKCKGSLHSGTSSPFHLSTANSKCLVLCGNTVTCQNLLSQNLLSHNLLGQNLPSQNLLCQNLLCQNLLNYFHAKTHEPY